ncbi:MAG: 3-phosphoshikimate 1-carboxyvinyltransferase [Armatimonadota bacterium]|jgi:3-phosphoshikimate 1-carboxyvinyltransferase
MKFVCRQSKLRGEVRIPGSKSHTIRAVAIASLAGGESHIREPLVSNDTLAAVDAYRALGADIEVHDGRWAVHGTGGDIRAPENVIDVRNSGVTLRTALGTCALLREGMAVLTGDEQIRRRPAGPLARSLNDLGASVRSTRGAGSAPFVVEGRLRGGETSIEGATSQYVTGLLINAPLADGESQIHVTKLNEAPYVGMTVDWLQRQGISLEQQDLREFRVPGGQGYTPVDRAIPADFSSATFFLCAGALPDSEIVVLGLDLTDTQGDKAVVDYVAEMGAQVRSRGNWIGVEAKQLVGCEIDLNATPDALPMLAVLGCFARGTTRLVNVPQARIKESDRISAMARELRKLGARVEELEDGIVVHESPLQGAEVDGHGDHRVVMALAVAGCAIPGETVVRGAEAAAVTFPEFAECMQKVGAKLFVEV